MSEHVVELIQWFVQRVTVSWRYISRATRSPVHVFVHLVHKAPSATSANHSITTGTLHRAARYHCYYTVNHKKGGSTFVIITLENLDGF